jgi:hypothetical protein
MASESPVAFRPALSRKDAVKPPSAWPVGVVMFFAHLPNAGRMDSPLPDPGHKPDRRESPSPAPWARLDRMDSPSPPVLNVSPSPPDRVETPSPVSGARLDPARPDRMYSPSPPDALNVSPSPPDRVETPSPVSGTRLDLIAGTPGVPGASVPPSATPVPAASPRAAGIRLPAPLPPHSS